MKDRLITFGLIALLIAAAGLIIYIHISTAQAWLLNKKLQIAGSETTAQVLALEETISVRGPSYCEVTFAYDAANERFTKTSKVSQDFCHIFDVGSQAEILYLTTEPETADLTWGGYVDMQFFIMLLCDGGVSLVAIFAAIGYKINNRITRQNSTEITLHPPTLPLVIVPPRGSQLMDMGCIFPFGLLVMGLMGFAFISALVNWQESGVALPLVLLVSGAPFFAFGAFLVYLSLKDFVHSFTFTADHIFVRHILGRSKKYPAATLRNVTLEARPLRGERKAFVVVLYFADGTQIDVQSSNFFHSDDYAPETLQQLRTHLQELYF